MRRVNSDLQTVRDGLTYVARTSRNAELALDAEERLREMEDPLETLEAGHETVLILFSLMLLLLVLASYVSLVNKSMQSY